MSCHVMPCHGHGSRGSHGSHGNCGFHKSPEFPILREADHSGQFGFDLSTPMVSHGFRCAPQGDVAQILFFGSFQDFWYCEGQNLELVRVDTEFL